jgi:hypothetical protein
MGWLSKRFMFIRCVSDFGKSCWLDKGDGLLYTVNLGKDLDYTTFNRVF